MRRLHLQQKPPRRGAIPFLLWVAGAHILVGYVLAPLLSPFGIVFSVKELPEYYTLDARDHHRRPLRKKGLRQRRGQHWGLPLSQKAGRG